jgi:transcriptional regulator with GAF, ATPase, and Fis domain
VYIPIIFLTGHGDIPMSVRAIKAGALEFLTKPLDPEDLLSAIQEGMLEREYPGAPGSSPHSDEIVGASSAYRKVLKRIAMVAPTDSTVLIQGETGTGKELVALEIHKISRRKDQPLVRVNCASIPKELYESEFFGHVRGAFTGAFKDRVGRFEAAHGGTLFLDEIGEVPLDLQSKLLRALQEKQYERVGDERTKRADVRIIAATNRDLKQEVEAGRFRQDLYYRLNVFPVEVAPLRERREDIPLLAKYFVGLLAKELKCPKPRLTEAGVASLQNYDWPGNVRELRNVIERAIIVAGGKALDFELPMANVAPMLSLPVFETRDSVEPEFLTEPEIQRRERENLRIVLQKSGWKIKGADGAAELLGVKPTTLISRIKKMGLKRQDPLPLSLPLG